MNIEELIFCIYLFIILIGIICGILMNYVNRLVYINNHPFMSSLSWDIIIVSFVPLANVITLLQPLIIWNKYKIYKPVRRLYDQVELQWVTHLKNNEDRLIMAALLNKRYMYKIKIPKISFYNKTEEDVLLLPSRWEYWLFNRGYNCEVKKYRRHGKSELYIYFYV